MVPCCADCVYCSLPNASLWMTQCLTVKSESYGIIVTPKMSVSQSCSHAAAKAIAIRSYLLCVVFFHANIANNWE